MSHAPRKFGHMLHINLHQYTFRFSKLISPEISLRFGGIAQDALSRNSPLVTFF